MTSVEAFIAVLAGASFGAAAGILIGQRWHRPFRRFRSPPRLSIGEFRTGEKMGSARMNELRNALLRHDRRLHRLEAGEEWDEDAEAVLDAMRPETHP